jgi:hypothetical protein
MQLGFNNWLSRPEECFATFGMNLHRRPSIMRAELTNYHGGTAFWKRDDSRAHLYETHSSGVLLAAGE